MLEHIFLKTTRQRLNLALLLLMVLFHPIPVNVDARGRGGDYPNLALGKESYMVRLQDNLPPASNGNDGNLATAVRSTSRTIDAYWEVDLGQEYAVDRIRVIPDSGFEDRMTHTVVRLFDQEHTSVYSRHMDSVPRQIFEVRCDGPRRARYVRVGLENKERSTPAGASSWDTYIGIKEVEVFGREPAEIGLFSFDTSAARISSGESVTLNWLVADITKLNLYPGPNIDLLHSLTDVLGAGSITVFPEQSTEYLLVAENTFGVYVKAVAVIVDDVPLSVRINEIMTRNRQTLKNGYGDTSDWIELHNPSYVAVEMAGCGLSDKLDNPMKWIFPDVKIPPHDYLIVFASGAKELVEPNDPKGYLHTNWKLDSNGETVVLTAPDGVTVLDAIVDYPAQREDLAYGQDIQENLTFLEPTPGSINRAQSYQGWLHPPVFSHERGFYDSPFMLTIENTDSNAVMLISVDDSIPYVPASSLTSFPVAETVTVRAAVKQDGYKSPEITTHSYLFVDDVISSSVMDKGIAGNSRYISRLRKGLLDLPTFIVSVPVIPDDRIERQASLEILWPDGKDAIQINCGFARYGGAWTNFAKKNYKLKFRKIYGAGKLRAPLFEGFDHGIPAVDEFDTLELRGGSHDMNARGFYMAPCFVEDSMLDMGS
ncbi:MAG: lamin tail domain-containing protein, partial [candidate division Zixibacteria bacterium]|nr:lamin tail domain-containing protein [candidate division Zixibacteria bacterium]